MRNFALFMALLYLGVSAAQAQERDRMITVQNHVGDTIVELYGSRVATGSWENDLLGDGVMDDASHRQINMYDGTEACRFDFKAVLADGSKQYRWDQDVCVISTLTFGPLRHGAEN
ncbi:hypothetical protein E5A73_07630 [Sphingomonas gei]|uniref:Argininosuccinate lyase n=1 Tax=Sphingomonas gei TaxID=1395960 RepID=A0A4V3QZF4_9SPHN|nr:hypothetical protein [Sphingomonas gei]TGX53992.1 hypothetical protein E5A73_07630 [Sphingomonas gei]